MLRMDSVSKKYLHRGQFVTAWIMPVSRSPRAISSPSWDQAARQEYLAADAGRDVSPSSGQVFLDGRRCTR